MLRDFLERLKNKKIYIVGISGAEGATAAKFLIKYKLDNNIESTDFSTRKYFKESFYKLHESLPEKNRKKLLKLILSSNINIYYKEDYLKNIEKADVIFASQGWIKHKSNYPKLKNIFRRSPEKFLSITKLYLELIEGKIIGITGTNGKSTVARLVYEICKKGPRKVFFTGNDRSNIQILDKIIMIKNNDLVVLEISDRQLIMPVKKSPHIAVITNITPNHLDDHETFEKYIEIKKRILDYQSNNNFAILNYDNKITKKIGQNVKAKVYYFSIKRKLKRGAFLEKDRIILNIRGRKELLTTLDKIKVPGMHNIENILAASLAARLGGISVFNIKKAVEKFRGIKQRLEYVATKAGRKFYYDRQGTTPDATITAVESFIKNRIILIIGGEDKGMDYKRLVSIISKKVKYAVVLPGSGSEKIIKEFKKIKFKRFNEAKGVKEAVNKACLGSQKGDIIILSPACVYAKHEFTGSKNLTFYDFVKKLK